MDGASAQSIREFVVMIKRQALLERFFLFMLLSKRSFDGLRVSAIHS